MTKNEFLSELRKNLLGLPSDDIDERVNFYAEMIDDMMEEGLTEGEAIEKIGDPKKVAEGIIADTPLRKIIKERMKPKKEINPWIIILIVLCALPFIGTIISVILSLIAVLISVIAAFWAITVSLGGAAIGCIGASVVFFIQGSALKGVFVVGVGLVCVGLTILMTFAGVGLIKWVFRMIKALILKIKSAFIQEKRK